MAQTEQTTLPVHDTLDHFLGHVKLVGWERLRTPRVQRLVRMKALDAARLPGRPGLLIDATGLICLHQRHCPHCLVQRHGKQTLYLHQVLEAKLLGPVPVGHKTVEGIAQQGRRYRWKGENEGFNRQKNSGLNLEHVSSIDPENWKVYYLLLQIAFILTQLLERGSLLRRWAEEWGRPVGKRFGSLKNVAWRLLDSVRYVVWEEEWFDAEQAARLRLGLDSS